MNLGSTESEEDRTGQDRGPPKPRTVTCWSEGDSPRRLGCGGYLHIEKQTNLQKTNILRFFTCEIKQFFLVRLLFSIFFSVSPNLVNIRVDFAQNLFWNYVIYYKKNKFLSFTQLRKKLRLQMGQQDIGPALYYMVQVLCLLILFISQ